MQGEARRWVRKAESDLKGARQLGGGTPQLNDLICFHCQQAAESDQTSGRHCNSLGRANPQPIACAIGL